MGEVTEIGWTDKTWSPWFGCTKVHTGCLNCYAEADNAQYNRNGDPKRGIRASWGPGAPRKLRKDWDKPLKWARDAAKAGQRWKVFPSLCDPFDAEAPAGALEQFCHLIWGTARVCGECGPTLEAGHDFGCSRPADQQGGLDWLLLTKRPERAGFPGDWDHLRRLVWLLVSVSDQATADKYVPLLLASRGWALRGLSYEPAVGPMDPTRLTLARFDGLRLPASVEGDGLRGWCGASPVEDTPAVRGLQWVIAGGESGGKRRACDVRWFEALSRRCSEAGVPFFMKQDSALYPGQQGRLPPELWARKQFPAVEVL